MPTNTANPSEEHDNTDTSVRVLPGRMLSLGSANLWLRWLLTLLILLTGIAVVFQVHGYRKSFTESQRLRVERKKLDTEWHKLLIEQQTFGATTQIGGRAVVSMGMYSPKHSDIITVNVEPAGKYTAVKLQPVSPQTSQASSTALQNTPLTSE